MKNKVVISGGASGLGASVARKLSALEWDVHVLDIDKERLDKISSVEGVSTYYCDVADRTQCADVMNKVGMVTHVVAAAALWTDENYEKENPEAREAAIRSNVLGLVEFCKSAVEKMDTNKDGRILIVSSSGGIPDSRGSYDADWHTYSATKWASTGYAKALRESLEDTKLQVSTLHPGGFDSNFYEESMGANAHGQDWMMQTSDVADIAVFTLTRPPSVYMEKVIFTKA